MIFKSNGCLLNRPLLIGSDLQYTQIDMSVLARHGISPLFLYVHQLGSMPKSFSLVCDELSVDSVSEVVSNNNINSIVNFNDNFVLEASKLRSAHKIEGITEKEALKFKSKRVMYECLGKYISVPPVLLFSQSLTYSDISSHFNNNKLFIKPDSRAGSEGTGKIFSESDFDKWLRGNYNSEYDYIIQPYIDFSLYHCDIIVSNNKIIYSSARQYSYPNHLFLQGNIIASLPINDVRLEEAIKEKAEIVKDVLQLVNGVMHIEFFSKGENDIIFLETNLRQPGGAINLMHSEVLGVSIETIMVLLECGVSLDKIDGVTSLYMAGYIPRKRGTVTSIETPELKGNLKYDIRVKVGDKCSSPLSASDASASFVGKYKNHEDLYNDFLLLENNGIINYQNDIERDKEAIL